MTDDDFVKLFQERAGLKADGFAGPDTLAYLDMVIPPKAFQDTGAIPAEYYPMLSKIESNDRPYVKAATSSASGLYQFTRATWLSVGGSWGEKAGLAFGGLQPAPAEQLERVQALTAKNSAYLRSKEIPINRASLYAAHFLGSVTAAKVIGANTDARADAIAGEAATRANESILRGKTVGQFLGWLHKKTGDWAR